MVSQIINVIVNSKGAVTVQKQLSAIGETAKQTSTYLNGLRAILASALTFSGLGSIVETVDTFTQLQNRLRLVSDSADMVSTSWERLLGIANTSYSTLDSTVNLYYRVAQAYKAWGESAEDAFEFTELFQKSAILSGSTMQTTAQAVYQFSQALNKGKLDGDEFRSVLEGLPYVANIIQKSLGVTRSELYEMSKDGKITVDRIKQAFEDAAAVIRGDFAGITPTIGMAINVFRNNWTDFIGDIQTSTGVFSGLAQLILLVADNFKVLAAALTPVVLSLAFLAGKLVLGLVVTGFKDMYNVIRPLVPLIASLNAAMWANPYVLAAAAIVAVVAAIIYFRNELGLTNEVLSAVWESVKSGFMTIFNYATMLASPILAVLRYFFTWQEIWNGIKIAATTTWTVISTMFSGLTAAAKSFLGYLSKTFGPVFQEMIEVARAFNDLLLDIYKTIASLVTPAIEALAPVFRAVWTYIEPALKKFADFLRDVLEGWRRIATYITTNFSPIIKDAFEGWILLIRSVIDWVKNLIESLQNALSLIRKVATGAGGSGGSVGANYGAQFYAGEFNTGGGFKVGGTGAGRDETPVSFRANRGERVTVETKKQQRQNDSAYGQAANVNVPVSIVNVVDPAIVPQAMESSDGQRVIINSIRTNRDEVLRALGVS